MDRHTLGTEASPAGSGLLRLGGCAVDLDRRVVRREGGDQPLTDREAALLAYLVAHRVRPVSRDELLRRVWGYSDRVVSRAVDTTVRRLRVKIEDDPTEPRHVVTVRGEGYRFRPLPAPAPAADATPAPVPLPRTDGPFLGRAADLDRLDALLGQTALLTLKGPAGVGKTRLALELARRRADAGDAVWFCDVSAAHDEAALVAAVVSVLGVVVRDGEDPRGPVGRALAARGPGVLVLDNVEQVIAGARAAVAAWAGPGVRVLLTSRRRLHAPAERVFELTGLAPAAAVALVRTLAERAGHPLDPADDAAIAELARRLDHLPLALHLAAARLDVLSPAEVLARLDDRFAVLDRPDGERSLADALAWSWDLLSPAERRVLVRCALFRGGCTADALGAVVEPELPADAPWVVDLLASLRDRSLVVAERADGGTRFRLLECVRAFVADRDPDDPERRAAVRRHAEHVAAVGERCVRGLRTPGAARAVRTLRAERENLSTAFERTLADDPPLAGRIALVLHTALRASGAYAERLDLLSRALDQAVPPLLRARLLEARGNVLRGTGRLRDALADGDAALALVPDGPPTLGAAVHTLLGRLWTQRGDRDRAGAHFEAAMALDPPDPLRFDVEVAQAMFWGDTGDVPRARATLEAALARACRAGDLAAESSCGTCLGVLLHRAGDAVRAEAMLLRVIAIGEQIGNRGYIAGDLNRLGVFHLDRGRPHAALRQFTEARRLFARAGNRGMVATVDSNLGTLHLLSGRYDAGRACLRECLDVFDADGDVNQGALVRVNLGILELEAGRPADARRWLEAGLQQAGVQGLDRLMAMAVGALGLVDIDTGRHEDARARLEQAIATAPDDPRFGAWHASWLAWLEHVDGDPQAAIAGYEAAIARVKAHGDWRVEGAIRSRLAAAQAAVGALDAARRGLRRARALFERALVPELLEAADVYELLVDLADDPGPVTRAAVRRALAEARATAGTSLERRSAAVLVDRALAAGR